MKKNILLLVAFFVVVGLSGIAFTAPKVQEFEPTVLKNMDDDTALITSEDSQLTPEEAVCMADGECCKWRSVVIHGQPVWICVEWC